MSAISSGLVNNFEKYAYDVANMEDFLDVYFSVKSKLNIYSDTCMSFPAEV
jgi:hypothetical protein